MIYRCKYLVTLSGNPIPNGCLRIEKDRIVEVGTLEELKIQKDEKFLDYPDAIILPGLINAHCHLELGMVRGQLPRGESFPIWANRLRKVLENIGAEVYREAAKLGIMECLKNGITTIVDVGNSGAALNELANLPIRSFGYLEVLGLNPKISVEKFSQAQAMIADRSYKSKSESSLSPSLFSAGITCHAPFSCSVELQKLIAKNSVLENGPYCLHVAESAEEISMFRDGHGPLMDFCRRIFPDLILENQHSPIRFLNHHGLIPEGSLFAHCNFMDEEDMRILSEKSVSIVHCPRSKEFFNHGGFDPFTIKKHGINICLGTDSLASNEGFNLFEEMTIFHSHYPNFSFREILEMATVNGAKALGLEGQIGVLQPGAKADFIGIGLRHHPDYDLYEEIITEAHEVLFVTVDGDAVMV